MEHPDKFDDALKVAATELAAVRDRDQGSYNTTSNYNSWNFLAGALMAKLVNTAKTSPANREDLGKALEALDKIGVLGSNVNGGAATFTTVALGQGMGREGPKQTA